MGQQICSTMIPCFRIANRTIFQSSDLTPSLLIPSFLINLTLTIYSFSTMPFQHSRMLIIGAPSGHQQSDRSEIGLWKEQALSSDARNRKLDGIRSSTWQRQGERGGAIQHFRKQTRSPTFVAEESTHPSFTDSVCIAFARLLKRGPQHHHQNTYPTSTPTTSLRTLVACRGLRILFQTTLSVVECRSSRRRLKTATPTHHKSCPQACASAKTTIAPTSSTFPAGAGRRLPSDVSSGDIFSNPVSYPDFISRLPPFPVFLFWGYLMTDSIVRAEVHARRKSIVGHPGTEGRLNMPLDYFTADAYDFLGPGVGARSRFWSRAGKGSGPLRLSRTGRGRFCKMD